MKRLHTLTPFLASALLSGMVLQAGLANADDTEIFFGGPTIDQGVRPNVLFILDDSGSMDWCLNKNSSSGCSSTSTTAPTRLKVMKDTFASVMASTSGINVGLMTLNQRGDASNALVPVQYIDTPINNKLSTPTLLGSGDDATRQTTGTATTNTTDNALVMGYIQTPASPIVRNLSQGQAYSNNNSTYYVKNGYICSALATSSTANCDGKKTSITTTNNEGIFLFRNLNVPKGVTLSSVKLILRPTSSISAKSFAVKISNTKTPSAFNDSTVDSTTEFTNSSSITSTVASNEHSLDLTNLFKTLQSTTPTSNPISDVAVRLSSTSTVTYYIGDTDFSPRLEIAYTGSENNSRTTGLRFQTVAIPKGATITSARINFVPAGSDDRPVTFEVRAENSADAAAFNASQDFTSRTKTSAVSTWLPAEWRTQSPAAYVEGPDVRNLVQEVVNGTDWCGNNAMAFFLTPTTGSGNRVAYSLDANNGLQPTLKVSYSGGENGCLNPIMDFSIIDAKDDGLQYRYTRGKTTNNTKVNITDTTLDLSDDSTYYGKTFVGARYRNLPILPGATVQEASVIVTPHSSSGTSATVKVRFDKTGNSAAFTTTDDDLGSRTLTSGTTCTFTSQGAGVPVSCSSAGLASELQSILTASNGWKDGNNLSLIITQTAASSLSLRAYEYSPGDAIKLRVKLKSGGLGSNSYTVRDYMSDLVKGLETNGSTPIVPTLDVAARYYTQLSSKHTDSAPSPITSACQPNHLVLLTDGQANQNTNAAVADIKTLTGGSCTVKGDKGYSDEQAGETCGRELSKWLGTVDQASYEGTNTITTSTIGFALQADADAKAFLQDLATNGGGSSYTADNASQLSQAFTDIIQRALATNTTYVNASAPVSSFNRADNLDELYFALFRPSESDRWLGNLKRYRMKVEDGVATIVDADDAQAIDPKTGFFKSSARSFWNTIQDGDDIAKGGAAAQLPAAASRKLFTYLGPTLGTELKSTNSAITKAMLGDSTMTDTERTNLLNYIRGQDTDADGNLVTRQALGDPIHSSPRLVTYGCKTTVVDGVCEQADMVAIIGSNEGFIHLFDAATGVEQSAFMPEALLANIKQLRDNTKSTSQKPRRYGMDNTVSLWVNDTDNDGVISSVKGDFVYAYATMGRGGRNIYALDITNRNAPKLLWQILGGSGEFMSLGQTWSAPVKTRIKVGSVIKEVLIFAGGYDTHQDELNNSDSTRSTDSMGNALYIVDAKTGAKLWSASSAAAANSSDPHLQLSKMKYSIPSRVRVIDIQAKSTTQVDDTTGKLNAGGVLTQDAEGLADQIFVGDMGGQVWRFFINNGGTGASLVSAGGSNGDGIFANLGGDTAATARRFYHEPDVSLLRVGTVPVLTVNIGSGYRGHPLNKVIEDRFYSLRTDVLFKSTNGETLSEADLYDATDNLLQSGSDTQQSSAETEFAKTRGGWYIDLKGTGEKVLSRALTAGGVLYFNTYEPTSSSAACSASVGKNRSYAVRLINATPASVALNEKGSYEDRYQDSNSGGISSDPQLFCQGDQCFVLPDPSIDPTEVVTPPLGKTYWTDETSD